MYSDYSGLKKDQRLYKKKYIQFNPVLCESFLFSSFQYVNVSKFVFFYPTYTQVCSCVYV